MSFILDALKKSELQRQRQTMPGLVDSQMIAPRARLPVWAIGLGALLAVNLLVLLIMLMRGWLQSPHTLASPSTSTHNLPAPENASRPEPGSDAHETHFSPVDSGTVYAPEIAVPPTADAPLSFAKSPLPNSRNARSSHRADPVLSDDGYRKTDSDTRAENDEILPTIDQISLSGAGAPPELHLDVHVYATRAADRFVYINMRKYHEGATLEEGVVLERIRRDGVVLNYQGLRFILPRQ